MMHSNVAVRLVAAMLLFGLLRVPMAQANAGEPMELIRDTSSHVLAEVVERRDELTQSPHLIYSLVEQYVLPSFDFQLMSRLVLGKFWNRASETEQQAFVEGFRELLVRTYANALLNYSGQEIKYLEVRPGADADRVTVPTQVFASADAPPIPIDFSLYRKDGLWKVYDIKIDGISLVSNYRNTFGGEINRVQLSGLIEKIREKNSKGEQ